MGFKETFKESPYESFGIVLGLIGFFVTFFYLLDTSDAATILIVSNIVTFLIVISSILLISFAQIIRQTRTVGIEYIASPDEVWDKSIAVLDEVIFTSDLTTNKQCYDVTSIPNWINYEQKVAECLNRGQSFDRIFCYSADSDNPNHRALEWFHNKICNDDPLDLDAVKQEISDFTISFSKEHNNPLTDEEILNLCSVITQFRDNIDGKLMILWLPFPSTIDFIAVEYTERALVVANFITTVRGGTYTAGVYASGSLAKSFIKMFDDVLSEWCDEGDI